MPLVEAGDDLRKRFLDLGLLLLLGQGFQGFDQRQSGLKQGQQFLAEQDQRETSHAGLAPHRPDCFRLDRDDRIPLGRT